MSFDCRTPVPDAVRGMGVSDVTLKVPSPFGMARASASIEIGRAAPVLTPLPCSCSLACPADQDREAADPFGARNAGWVRMSYGAFPLAGSVTE